MTDNFDLELPFASYYAMTSASVSVADSGVWYVLGSKDVDSAPMLLKIRIYVNYEKEAINCKTISADMELEKEVRLPPGSRFSICATENSLLVASDTQLLKLSLDKLEELESIDLYLDGGLKELKYFGDSRVGVVSDSGEV